MLPAACCVPQAGQNLGDVVTKEVVGTEENNLVSVQDGSAVVEQVGDPLQDG